MKRYCLQKNIVPSQGIHLVLTNHSYLVIARDDSKTSDGRVLFAVPWHDKIVVEQQTL
jgi:glycerol-3-phosphate dehydrogenase